MVALSAPPALAQKQTVVVYTAIENEQIADYMKALNKTLPNIELKILRLSTGDISARFMAEKDNMQAEAIWGVGATNILIFKSAGLLEPYAPKGLDKIQPLFRDKANPPSWVGIDIYMSAFCVNTEVTKKNNLPMPASWADLTKPVYKGQVVMPNPASSGTGYLSVASILQRMGEAEGWKYLDALDKNIAEYTKSGSKPCKDAAAGERAVGVSFEYVALEMKRRQSRRDGPGEGGFGPQMEANALTKKGPEPGCEAVPRLGSERGGRRCTPSISPRWPSPACPCRGLSRRPARSSIPTTSTGRPRTATGSSLSGRSATPSG
jgi:iron(III) transport system substrate-binding protein